MNKPYPVGTKIKYIGNCPKCKGKTSKIIEMSRRSCVIVLPQSKCSAFNTRGNIAVGWGDVELLLQKGEQLEFPFMGTSS